MDILDSLPSLTPETATHQNPTETHPPQLSEMPLPFLCFYFLVQNVDPRTIVNDFPDSVSVGVGGGEFPSHQKTILRRQQGIQEFNLILMLST